MITYTLKIGNGSLEYEDTDIKKVHKFASLYGRLPVICDNCKSPDIFLDYVKTQKGFEYFKVTCKKCGASLNFGQKKEGGFFIKHGAKMEMFKGGNKEDVLGDNPEVVEDQRQDDDSVGF